MDALNRKIQFIVNPEAGHGKAGAGWRRLEKRLRKTSLDFSAAFTKTTGHAVELTRDALSEGYHTVVAVGGDGTLNEVVNGLFLNGKAINSEAVLGVVPLGTGRDFARTIRMPSNPDEIVAKIMAGETRACDICLLTCDAIDGTGKVSRYFINIADAGFGSVVAQRVNKSSKVLGHFLTYLSILLRALFTYDNKKIKITFDERESAAVTANSIIVANGRFFGGGMLIAPQAEIDDAWLDIVIIGDITTTEAVLNIPKLYKGTLATHSKVQTEQGKKITLNSHEEVIIEADGEIPGKLPATFEILPAALRIII